MKIFELLSGDTDTTFQTFQQPDVASTMGATQPFGDPKPGTEGPMEFANSSVNNDGSPRTRSTAPTDPNSIYGAMSGNQNMNAGSPTSARPPTSGSLTGVSPGGSQPPQQQAGLWDMAKDFMSTPQPIGGTKPTPTPPTPTTPGQPPAQSSGIINRPFGGSAIGRNLDAINKGLTPPTK